MSDLSSRATGKLEEKVINWEDNLILSLNKMDDGEKPMMDD